MYIAYILQLINMKNKIKIIKAYTCIFLIKMKKMTENFGQRDIYNDI